MRSSVAFVLSAAFVLTFRVSQPVQAAESAPIASKRSIATLISSTDAVLPGQHVQLALRLRLAPGWHTYWRNPGDAGVPPSLDITASPGSATSDLTWPIPHKVAEGTLTTYAYTGDVVLPFTATTVTGAFDLKTHAEWLTCRDICVPEQADLELTLPAGTPSASPEASLIEAALLRVPATTGLDATLTPNGTLTLAGKDLPKGVTSAEFLPTTSGAVETAAAQTPVFVADSIRLKLAPIPTTPSDTTAMPGVVVLTDKHGEVHAYSVTPTLLPDPPSAPSLMPLILFALAGGLILNLMPCVFPILAMKAMALARFSGAEMRRVRAEAATYTLGVVVAFMALGAGLVALRSAGEASGWGFQFQSPVFVTLIAWLLFAIGLNLSGIFTVGGSLMGRGGGLARHGGHLGSFLTGILAVVVASPCTAPFMGTAIAGALALPSLAALTVFAALGVGLALPYALFAAIPRLSSVLPRPGAWMRTLQQVLAFPIYAATVWLVWVLSQQAGPNGVLAAGAGLLLIGAAGWALGLAEHRSGWPRTAARGTVLACGALLAAVLTLSRPGGIQRDRSEPFTTARLDELRNEGRPVFVDMTASWCLSCLVNERLALSVPAVQAAFAQSNVAYLKGDWTNQDLAISGFLHQLGQDGVPLYVLYAPGRPPVILPQLLSEGTVLHEIAKLKG